MFRSTFQSSYIARLPPRVSAYPDGAHYASEPTCFLSLEKQECNLKGNIWIACLITGVHNQGLTIVRN